MKKLLSFSLIVLMIVMLSSCADTMSVEACMTQEPVGFWYGIWHGMIVPWSLIHQLFGGDSSIFAAYNNGGWYQFGFWMGIASVASAAGRSSKCRKIRKQ